VEDVGNLAKGKWSDYVGIVGTQKELPEDLQNTAGLAFPEGALQNGGTIAAGDVVSYTYWLPQDEEPVPVFLRSKHSGINYMAPLYTRYDQNDRTHMIEVYTANKDITVTPKLQNGKFPNMPSFSSFSTSQGR